MDPGEESFSGGCDCKHVRYRMTSRPLIVHGCHCRWCKRETGGAFATNAMIEAERVVLESGEVIIIDTPSASGKGQKIARCPKCLIALWSNYGGAGEVIRFVRVGTLDDPSTFEPDVHIFTSTKQPWVQLPAGKPVFSEFYRPKEQWPAASLERFQAAIGKTRP